MNEVALIPYYDDFEMTLEWYQDLDHWKKSAGFADGKSQKQRS